MYVMGVDLGTSSLKYMILNQDKLIILKGSEEYPLLTPKPLFFEQNPIEWSNALERVFSKLDKNIKENLSAISFGGQMHGLVMLDKNKEILYPAILWNDQRNYDEVTKISEEFSLKEIVELTGNIPLTGFTLPKLLWVKKNMPDIYIKINKIMLPKDYLVFYLTGEYSTDYSDASGTLMLDVKNKCWQKKILEKFDIDENILPTLHNSSDEIGFIKKSIADKYNINANCKIIAGGGDQAVAALGSGIINNQEAILSLGTSGVVFVDLKEFPKKNNGKLHVFCDANYKYHCMGVMLSAAGSLKWLANNVYETNYINALVNEIEITDENHRLFFNPYLSGERTPINDPFAKGCFYGLEIGSKRKDITRAVLEGVSFGIRDIFEEFPKAIKPKRLRVNGGGTKSRIWLEIIANTLGIELDILETSDTVAYGAALLAFYRNKEITNDDISIKVVETIKPTPNLTSYYEKKYNVYKNLYPSLKRIERILW